MLVEPGRLKPTSGCNAILSAATESGNSPHAARLEKLFKQREKGKLRANPQKVADKIAAILEDPHPRLRYVVGWDAHLGLMLKRFLPSKVLEELLIKVSGIGV